MVNLDLWRDDRSNPRSLWKAWETVHRDFDSFFDDFSHAVRGTRQNGSFMAPACDIEETDKEFMLTFDMPGFKREDIQVEREGNSVTVSAKRERVTSDSKLHRSERQYGEYRRTFSLPDNVKGDDIVANYDDGVLQLTLPKAELAKPKRIEISESKGSTSQVNISEGQQQKLHS